MATPCRAVLRQLTAHRLAGCCRVDARFTLAFWTLALGRWPLDTGPVGRRSPSALVAWALVVFGSGRCEKPARSTADNPTADPANSPDDHQGFLHEILGHRDCQFSSLPSTICRIVMRRSLPSSPAWGCGARPQARSSRIPAADTRAAGGMASWLTRPASTLMHSAVCPRASDRKSAGIFFRGNGLRGGSPLQLAQASNPHPAR